MGSTSHVGRGNYKGEERVSRCEVISAVICAKTVELMEIPFGIWAQMGPGVVCVCVRVCVC